VANVRISRAETRRAALRADDLRRLALRADTQVGPYVASSAIAVIIAIAAGSGITARIAGIACIAYGRTRVCALIEMRCALISPLQTAS
jgi:hypothetical protein